MDKSMNIDSTALELLKIINSHSYDAYIVGGAIRDLLLGITPTDYDICTNMPISMLLTLFPYDDIEVSGQLFLSIKLRYKNKIFEITNTRIEGEYKKSGYPSKVTLKNGTSLKSTQKECYDIPDDDKKKTIEDEKIQVADPKDPLLQNNTNNRIQFSV